jgi:uncharacterized protein (TIGR03435 family)
MKTWILSVLLAPCCVALGQQQPAKPAFEVASIRPAKLLAMGNVRVGMQADAGMLRYTGVSLRDCIRAAYRVKEFQVQGPEWLGSERFDIVAKLPAWSSQDQIPEMLQDLLAERFRLALHRDKKEQAIYALVAAKGGPKLKAAEVPAEGGAPGGPGKNGPLPRGAMYMMMGPEGAHLKAASATLATLAEMISRFTERPVIDMTGIAGQYDFDLVFSPETMRNLPAAIRGPMAPPGGGEHPPAEPPVERAGSIYDSVQRYGLKLEPRKAPMEVLVVDHIERAPTEN